jgi:hypothetical protein
MDIRAQAIADAGGPSASVRDRLFGVGGIVAKIIICLTVPLGFYDHGFFVEVLRFVGIWLLISAANTICSYIMFYARNLLGHGMTWTSIPPLRYRIYAVAGFVLFALSELPMHLGGSAHLRAHPWAVAAWLFFIGFWAFMAWCLVGGILRARGGASVGLQHHRAQVADSKRVQAYDAFHSEQWTMHVGVSTGTFSRRDPSGSFVAGLHVRVKIDDAARGTLVFGSMGSGKTQFLRGCAVDAARQGSGLLAISAKLDDASAIVAIARQYRTAGDVHLVGADAESCNLLAGMSPERVGQAFKALSHDPKNPYWSNYAGLMMTAGAQLAWGLSGTTVQVVSKKEDVITVEREVDFAFSLTTIHAIIWGGNKLRFAAIDAAAAAIPTLRRDDPTKADALEAAVTYFTTSFSDLSESKATLAGVKSGLEPYILPLIGGTARKTWGDPDGINITKTIDAGEVVVLAPDKAKNAQVFDLVASFTVAHLADLALRRTARADNQPIVALMDEYGSYASTEHLSLIETARQARICLVMSSIGVTNLSARLGRDGAQAIPSAFSNLLVFSTGDAETKKLIDGRIGKVRMSDISSGSSQSSGTGTNGKSSTSSSTSHRISEVSVIDDEVWRRLGVFSAEGYATAIAIVSEDGRSLHDLVRVPPAVTA